MNVERNQIVKILAQESEIDYVNEAVAFLFVVSAFERLGWATDVLNLPIYYGTLYGPFSWIYWTVKRRVVRGSQELPTDRNAVLY